MSASPAAVAVQGVEKRFDETVALQDVSFEVRPGELFGFIGPDGAGKSTLFRVLTTLLLPTRGSAQVLGLDVVEDIWQLRARVGYMPGRFSLYQDLSVEENLRFFAAVFGTTVEQQMELIAPIYRQIEPFRDRRAGALSGGMKQKLALSCALVHRPEILFLDEPTTGVDAVSRREFWDLLADLKAGGLTIVVSTPYMDEAGRCDRIGLDAPASIGRKFAHALFAVRAHDRHRLIRELRAHEHAVSAFLFGDNVHYADVRSGMDPREIERDLIAYLHARGIADPQVQRIAPGIEDSFMALMGAPDANASAA
jgi:ABC-2 type transport system ATP-binding protein